MLVGCWIGRGNAGGSGCWWKERAFYVVSSLALKDGAQSFSAQFFLHSTAAIHCLPSLHPVCTHTKTVDQRESLRCLAIGVSMENKTINGE
jgi:hypothetical protein